MAGMKIAFLAIFDLTWTHFLAPKGPTMEFVNTIQDGLFQGCTYPTMMKLGTVIHYLK